MAKFYFLKNLNYSSFSVKISCYLLTVLTGYFGLSNISQNTAKAAGVVGNGTAASCTESALNAALNAGGNITFNCGTSPVVIAITQEKVISAHTTIDGGNLVTLSGSNYHRIFKVNSNIKLTIKNLTIANGFTTDQGAAINNPYAGIIVVSNCKFNNNFANKAGEYGGGAIFSGPEGTVTIDKSTFTNNKASIGGAIRILNSNLTVTNSSFTSNKAIDTKLGDGGAIYVDGANGDNGQIVIQNSTFTNNTATAYGGAFFNSLYNNNKTVIERSSFYGNSVGGGSNGQGGAIWSGGNKALGGHWQVNSNNTTLTVTDTNIDNNTASQQGGGIWLGRHPQGINITKTTFTNNIATKSNGGAITLGDEGKLNLTNSTISGNKANGAYSLAGGIMVAAGQAAIANTTIANNYAFWQGGGIVGGTKILLKNSIIAYNVANNGGNNWNIKHNCFDQMTNGGNNLQFPAPNLKNTSDKNCVAGIVTADPKLAPLANNGGLTKTRALLTGSPAINKGNNATCTTIDQRGILRPQQATCDVGAFEFK